MNRGGSWNNNAHNCRTANRNNNTPDNRNNNIGFRLVSPELKRKDGNAPVKPAIIPTLKKANTKNVGKF